MNFPTEFKFLGDNAQAQPGSLQDIRLHETAVAWIRQRLRKSMPKASWEESREDYAARLKQVVEGINNHHDVDALCRSFPTRLQK